MITVLIDTVNGSGLVCRGQCLCTRKQWLLISKVSFYFFSINLFLEEKWYYHIPHAANNKYITFTKICILRNIKNYSDYWKFLTLWSVKKYGCYHMQKKCYGFIDRKLRFSFKTDNIHAEQRRAMLNLGTYPAHNRV